MCKMTHSYLWRDSFLCVEWLIHICDMAHSYVWHGSFICVTWLTYIIPASYGRCVPVMCGVSQWRITASLLICVTYPRDMCDTTHTSPIWCRDDICESCHTYEWPIPGGFPIYHVPWSRTRRTRTPLEEFVPGASRGVLFLWVRDQVT